jgi:transposase-like protein
MSLNEPLDTRRNGQAVIIVPDPEVRPKAKHRRFTAEYKMRILGEAAACRQPGELGALLRREGLYSSLLTQWRRQQMQGTLLALAPKRRGPKPDPQADELARLRRENERLQERLKQAETVIEVQKKVSQLLGEATAPTSDKQT